MKRKHAWQAQSVILLALLIFLNNKTLKAQIFTEQAQEWGLTSTITAQEWGAGLSTYDFNQDGLDDITLVTDDAEILFYRNMGGESFLLTDFNIPSPNGFAKQLLWVDLDNDGDLDIFISTFFGEIKLYENDGDFNFEDITLSSGLPDQTGPYYGAAFGDYDNDGFLDLHITAYYWQVPPPANPDVLPNLWSRLFKNNGDGSFTDVTIASNLYYNPTVAFQSVWFDLDNDIDQDLFVIVDRSPGNHLFLNDGDDFSEITEDYGVSYPGNDFMSNSVADYNNDGYLDIFMTNSGSSFAGTPSVLLKNDEGNNLVDVSISVGLSIYDFGWGATWADVNNDGWKDLFFVTDEEFEQNNLFLNTNGIFSNAQNELDSEDDYPCFSVARGDFNNDGHYDLAVQAMNPNPSQLFINSGSDKHWVKVHLTGTVSNIMGIGSFIRAYVGDNTYTEYTFCGENYISQNSQYQIIGLDEASLVDSLKITYLSGHVDTYYNLPADSTYGLTEGETYNVQITATDTSICQGESITLNAGEHETYLWNTGETSNEIVITSSGTYTVETTNEFGITASSEIFITVNPLPDLIESVTTNTCNGDSLASIQLQNINGVDADSVIWSQGYFGDYIDSLPAGEYNYEFVDVNGCSNTGFVQISDPPVMTIFTESTPSDPIDPTGTIQITIFGGLAPYTVALGEDTVGTEISDLLSGNYLFTITDSNGCVRSVEVIVDSTLNTHSIETQTLSVFPVPVYNELNLSSSSHITSVLLLSSDGKVLMQIQNPDLKIDVSHLKAGLYILIVETSDKRIERRRVIKI